MLSLQLSIRSLLERLNRRLRKQRGSMHFRVRAWVTGRTPNPAMRGSNPRHSVTHPRWACPLERKPEWRRSDHIADVVPSAWTLLTHEQMGGEIHGSSPTCSTNFLESEMNDADLIRAFLQFCEGRRISLYESYRPHPLAPRFLTSTKSSAQETPSSPMSS